MMNSFDEEETRAEDLSKSERKRQMHALQAMGERLVSLPQSDLNLITISDERLSDAIALARRITARSGLKRQLQYIGKLMRSVDATAIEEGLAYLDQRNATSAADFHRVEAARDKLIEQGDAALGEIMAQWPSAESTLLRQWIRQHPKAISQGKQKAHAKKLFRYLSDLDRGEHNLS
jgi:ribosome-associated protein